MKTILKLSLSLCVLMPLVTSRAAPTVTAVALPFNQWTPVWTNGLGNGNFNFTATNLVNPIFPQRFFRLQLLQLL